MLRDTREKHLAKSFEADMGCLEGCTAADDFNELLGECDRDWRSFFRDDQVSHAFCNAYIAAVRQSLYMKVDKGQLDSQ